MADPTKTVHGNSLDSDAPAIGYTLREVETNNIMKYGESTQGKKRYPESYLKKNKLTFRPEVAGTKREMHSWQHNKIVEHKATNGGTRPPLNKNDY